MENKEIIDEQIRIRKELQYKRLIKLASFLLANSFIIFFIITPILYVINRWLFCLTDITWLKTILLYFVFILIDSIRIKWNRTNV